MGQQTSLGAIALTVADLEAARAFYERAIGLRTLGGSRETILLGVQDDTTLVELVGDRSAPRRPRRTTGLFHLALVVPTRIDLARAVQRVTHAGARFTGASDHLVSEALYLDDPEGNGIEIYRDRPCEEWPYRDGRLEMDTLPLDLEGLLGESGADTVAAALPAGTRLGHVHLQVADLGAAERFYAGLLGFDVTVRDYPGALFVSAGGYHHHFGLNTWAGEGAPAPAPGSRGLRRVEVVLGNDRELSRVRSRLASASVPFEVTGAHVLVADPSRNSLLLRAG